MLDRSLFAGFGGQGMLLIGQFLATAAMNEGKFVSWLPSYGPEMRGGTANCSVCVSDREIASPVLSSADCVVAMNRPSLDKFESMVAPGGTLIVNSSLIDVKSTRSDINVFYVPANETAEALGTAQAANMVILGAYLEIFNSVSVDSILDALLAKLGTKKAHLIPVNRKALDAGAEIIRKQRAQ